MSEIWKALDIHGHVITSVIAGDVQEATEEAERQLTLNESRLFYHRSWVMGGRKVVAEEHLEQAQAELRFRFKCWEALWTSEQVRLAAEQVSEELAELGKKVAMVGLDVGWEYRMALVKLAGDVW